MEFGAKFKFLISAHFTCRNSKDNDKFSITMPNYFKYLKWNPFDASFQASAAV
jgi:hypothetical protein